MTLKSIGITSDGLLGVSSKKALLIASRGLIDAGIVAGILLEIPLIVIPDDVLHNVNILDVIQFLVITDAQKNALCDLVKQELNIVDVNQTININDTIPNSVIYNLNVTNKAIVNNDPNGLVTEIDIV